LAEQLWNSSLQVGTLGVAFLPFTLVTPGNNVFSGLGWINGSMEREQPQKTQRWEGSCLSLAAVFTVEIIKYTA
jgi:hypothetical protein